MSNETQGSQNYLNACKSTECSTAMSLKTPTVNALNIDPKIVLTFDTHMNTYIIYIYTCPTCTTCLAAIDPCFISLFYNH